jgi:hypothetical protein
MSTRYEVAKDVAENGIYDSKGKLKKLEGKVLDALTAQALICVYEALSPTAQTKFDSIPLMKLVDFCWKQVSLA